MTIEEITEAKRELSERLLVSEQPIEVVIASGRRSKSRNTFKKRDLRTLIHAVGVGPKVVHGKTTGDSAIRVYVQRKLPLFRLALADVLPVDIGGVPVDVVEARRRPYFLAGWGRFRRCRDPFQPGRRKARKPPEAGISVGHRTIQAGTLGYFCRPPDNDDHDSVYILSCGHVFGILNGAKVADDIYQPGSCDGGCALEHRVARLDRHSSLAHGGPNRVDAAIAQLLPGVHYAPTIMKIGSATGTARAAEGMQVIKHGRTTGYTEGRVLETTLDQLIYMSAEDRNSPCFLFENQIAVEADGYRAFARGGDSGALILDRVERRAVGMVLAATEGYTVANHIDEVLRELRVDLILP